MMVSEVQALWGAVYLLGGLDSTGKSEGDLLDLTTPGRGEIC